MSQITQMNRATFATLARSEHVHLPASIVTADEVSDDPDRVQQKLDGARTVIGVPQRLQATLATYDKLVAVVPASQPYQPPRHPRRHLRPPGPATQVGVRMTAGER